MDTSKIKVIVIGILATFVALYLGISAATAQSETIAWVVGSAVFLGCLSLGHRIWLLIPFMSALGISLRLPGQPSSALAGQLLMIGFCAPLFLMRKLPFGFVWRELEFWGFVLTLCVVQVYVRHPIGLNVFGGESVGGKPYILYAVTLASGVLLAGLKVPASELKWVLRLSILGGLLGSLISILGVFVPVIGYMTGASYERTDQPNSGDSGGVVDAGAATRIGFLGGLGTRLALWISAYISPLRACLRPLWGLLILFAIVAAMMSGFRNNVIYVGFVFLLGVMYRSGFSGVVLSVSGLIGGLALLAVVNTIHPLPPNIQRSLTFLPGTWEERYRRDAEGSTEWRFEIWREALTSKRWIENKILGDGLGFKSSELASQMNARKGERGGISGFSGHRDAILKSGDYHSGPVQTIRTIGYVGLMFMLIAQVRLAVYAHRQIQRCRDTEWFPLALFVGLPLILYPFFFVFVFGTFSDGAVGFFLGYGMVRLLESNLPLPAYVMRHHGPYILRNRQKLVEAAGANRWETGANRV